MTLTFINSRCSLVLTMTLWNPSQCCEAALPNITANKTVGWTTLKFHLNSTKYWNMMSSFVYIHSVSPPLHTWQMDMKYWNGMCLDEQQRLIIIRQYIDDFNAEYCHICWMEIYSYCSVYLQYSFSLRYATISSHTVWYAVVTNARQAFPTFLILKVCRSGYAEFHGPAGLAIH